MSDPDLRAILNDVRTVLDCLWTLKQSPSDAGKVMLSASGHSLPLPSLTLIGAHARLFSTATSRCQRNSASTGTNHELKRSLWPDLVTQYVQSPPTALCGSTVICGGRTSLSAREAQWDHRLGEFGVVSVPLATSCAAQHSCGISKTYMCHVGGC